MYVVLSGSLYALHVHVDHQWLGSVVMLDLQSLRKVCAITVFSLLPMLGIAKIV